MGDRRRKIAPDGLHTRQKATNGAGNETPSVRNVCVYCGSNSGINPAYTEAARSLGRHMAKAGVGLVYGGGGLGLMGELARTVLAAGGRVTGIIPAFLSKKERMLRDAHEMIVVDDMHQRKKLMFDKSDAFVALPGGIGTLEELVEQLTWAQLGRHNKPIVLVNIEGFLEAPPRFARSYAQRRVHPAHHGSALHHSEQAPRTCWTPCSRGPKHTGGRPRPRSATSSKRSAPGCVGRRSRQVRFAQASARPMLSRIWAPEATRA